MKTINIYQLERIKNFLLNNPRYFADHEKSVKAIILNEAFYFRILNPKNLIYWDELFICDIYGRELWICRHLQKKKYDKRRKLWLDIEPVSLILKIDDRFYHEMPRFNGYWMITPEMLNFEL